MGELLMQTERNVGAKGSVVIGDTRLPVKDNTPTLASLGVTKRESSLVSGSVPLRVVLFRRVGSSFRNPPQLSGAGTPPSQFYEGKRRGSRILP
jgi:hypothetical protein